MAVEAPPWPAAAELEANRQRLLNDLRRQLHEFEARYELRSDHVAAAIDAGRLMETSEISDWLFAFDTYRALSRQRPARVE